MIVELRSAPVDNISIGTSSNVSIRLTYASAFAGSSFKLVTSAVDSCQPGKSS